MNLSTPYCLQAPTSEMGDNLFIIAEMWLDKGPRFDWVAHCLLLGSGNWLRRVQMGDIPDLLAGVLFR